MKEIFIAGTSHERYQIRILVQDGADAFRRHVLQTVRSWRVQTIAGEMSEEGLKGRRTVCDEVAKDEGLSHIFCDPNCSQREALGISKENTPSDIEKREKEWLRRLQSPTYPVLFVCGANHVGSFARCCRDDGLVPTIVTDNFEARIPLDQQFL
jgi:hypothetical protein